MPYCTQCGTVRGFPGDGDDEAVCAKCLLKDLSKELGEALGKLTVSVFSDYVSEPKPNDLAARIATEMLANSTVEFPTRPRLPRNQSAKQVGERLHFILSRWAHGSWLATHVSWDWSWVASYDSKSMDDMREISHLLGDHTPILTPGIQWLFVYAHSTRRILGKTHYLASPYFSHDKVPGRTSPVGTPADISTVNEAVSFCSEFLRTKYPEAAPWKVRLW